MKFSESYLLLAVITLCEAFTPQGGTCNWKTRTISTSYSLNHLPISKRSTVSSVIHQRKCIPRRSCFSEHSVKIPANLKMSSSDLVEGVYKWTYSGGEFPVELRAGGYFYCKQYPAAATWICQDDVLKIDWKKYGKYELKVKGNDGKKFEGAAVAFPDSWRKAEFVRPFTKAESSLVNGGSVWAWEYQGGRFEVEFHSDGFNHFVCKAYPAHAHWSLDGDKVTINWGEYGVYELTVDPAGSAMAGHARGQPASWRRAAFLHPLAPRAAADPDCDHDH